LRRKPRTYGEHVSHMFLATHASILTPEYSTSPYGLASSPSGRSPTES